MDKMEIVYTHDVPKFIRFPEGAAVFPLHAAEEFKQTKKGHTYVIPVGLSVAVPVGSVGLITAAGSISSRGFYYAAPVAIIFDNNHSELFITLRCALDSYIKLHEQIASLVILQLNYVDFVQKTEFSKQRKSSRAITTGARK